MPTPWTIQDLSSEVELALHAISYEGPENGQVRAVPNLRTIRYYTTVGLLDRPAAFKGRTALYDRHHLLQLVAIKRLQATGLSLVEVQEKLAGLTPSALAEIAKVDTAPRAETAVAAVEAASEEMADAPPSRREDFWAAPAASLDLDTRALDGDSDDAADNNHSSDSDASDSDAPVERAEIGVQAPPRPPLQGIRASDILTILVDANRAITDDDEQAIRNAAAPLLAVLQKRGLVPALDEGDA